MGSELSKGATSEAARHVGAAGGRAAATTEPRLTAVARSSNPARILNITRDLPFFPGGHGGNTRTYSLLRELCKSHRYTIVSTIYTAEHNWAAEELRARVHQFECYRSPGAAAPPPRAANHSEAPRTMRSRVQSAALALARLCREMHWLPIEVRDWEATLANMQPAIRRALSSGAYDFLQIECSDNAMWVTRIPFRGAKLLVFQDIKTVAWWRRFKSAESVPVRLHALAETLRFLAFERRYSRYFDHLVAMSERDRELLRKITGHPSIGVVPNGVDTGHYRNGPAPDGQRVVFTATMNHPPNHDGILFFARDIWPRIAAAVPAATLDIVGNAPPPDVRALAGDRIRVTGFVPDTRPYLAAASVFICPLRFASGTRLKILEAMAMGRPVVSTRIGAEGIDCQVDDEILIDDDPLAFAEAVIRLLRDKDLRTRMGRAARGAAERYSWRTLAGRMEDSYEAARRQRPAGNVTRIGLNGLFLIPGGATGGLEPYFNNLSAQLLRLDAETRYVLLANPSNELEFSRLHADNLEKHVVRKPFVRPVVDSLLRGIAGRLLGAPPAARPQTYGKPIELDVLHCFPGYIDDFAEQYPCILTVADIQHEFHPEFFTVEELTTRRTIYRPSAERALRIIAISAFTRQTLIDRYDIAPEKIEVVPLAAGPQFFRHPGSDRIAKARAEHGLPSDYCIYPANLWPHKNHPLLLEALTRIAPARRPHLILTGSSPRTSVDLNEEIRARDLGGHVTWLGFVDGADLPALYAGARMMVFPSLFEGFGMPVVEAMAVGCPVACSATTSLPEIAGDAAVLFDPTDADAIVAAIERLWGDASLRARLAQEGRARARTYTWRRTALETLAVYHKTIAAMRGEEAES
jgi:glycosyltransferase involved in cell wall biosynthesis